MLKQNLSTSLQQTKLHSPCLLDGLGMDGKEIDEGEGKGKVWSGQHHSLLPSIYRKKSPKMYALPDTIDGGINRGLLIVTSCNLLS